MISDYIHKGQNIPIFSKFQRNSHIHNKFLLLNFCCLHFIYAGNFNTEKIGDYLQIVIPLSAYSTTLYLKDSQGQTQFYQSYGSTLLSTYALKYSVREKRPDSDARDSFPSGHSSSAFSGASFIHARYGIKYAIIPYIGATFTAYSRVQANRHYVQDVIAGALLGSFSSWYFVTHYESLRITPILDTKYKGLSLSFNF